MSQLCKGIRTPDLPFKKDTCKRKTLSASVYWQQIPVHSHFNNSAWTEDCCESINLATIACNLAVSPVSLTPPFPLPSSGTLLGQPLLSKQNSGVGFWGCFGWSKTRVFMCVTASLCVIHRQGLVNRKAPAEVWISLRLQNLLTLKHGRQVAFSRTHTNECDMNK